MSINSSYDIPSIESALFQEIKKLGLVPTENLFVGSRPSSVPENMGEFLVVKALTGIDDQFAYGTVVVGVHVYVKNMTGGIRDSAKFTTAFNAITAVLPIELAKYRFQYQNNSNIVQDGLGWSVQIFNLLTFIKR